MKKKKWNRVLSVLLVMVTAISLLKRKDGSDIQSVTAGKVQGLFIFSARSAERYFLAHRAHTLTASFSASALSGVTKAVLYT